MSLAIWPILLLADSFDLPMAVGLLVSLLAGGAGGAAVYVGAGFLLRISTIQRLPGYILGGRG
jgi:hypothetical protein